MSGLFSWSHTPVVVGLIAMVVGAVDPLEGSLLILPGAGLVAFGAYAGAGRHRRLAYWAVGLLAVGVGALFGLSALGGIGGRSGHPMWWGLVLLPYPVGWVLGLVGAIQLLRERQGSKA